MVLKKECVKLDGTAYLIVSSIFWNTISKLWTRSCSLWIYSNSPWPTTIFCVNMWEWWILWQLRSITCSHPKHILLFFLPTLHTMKYSLDDLSKEDLQYCSPLLVHKLRPMIGGIFGEQQWWKTGCLEGDAHAIVHSRCMILALPRTEQSEKNCNVHLLFSFNCTETNHCFVIFVSFRKGTTEMIGKWVRI